MDAPPHGGNKLYILVWVWLMALLLAGVGIVRLGWSKTAVVGVVLGLSTVKAVLVALHYMHLKTDRRLLAFVLLAPLILITLAAGVVFSSRLFRF